ncbi:hypothetical protein AXG93_4382s1190 [Marchantia polymorpha subsp. ruderalis]|uniref:Uncharacterized protein n=1 Tax=Marchantia polymorpha subsp. ruderalis TaxID=1480154 RepID=A0A176VM01_MARPO|nr:hypothetical protein AXG93_4382s1190 [Marchantia polymorpha subsp. ruderalis]
MELGVNSPVPVGDWGADSRIAGLMGLSEGKYGNALRLDGARLGLLDRDATAGTLELRYGCDDRLDGLRPLKGSPSGASAGGIRPARNTLRLASSVGMGTASLARLAVPMPKLDSPDGPRRPRPAAVRTLCTERETTLLVVDFVVDFVLRVPL